MTKIYFVRHAQPIHSWEDDRTRPLSEAGHFDRKNITELLKTISIDHFYSSPYKRSVDTISEIAKILNMNIHIDERFRERQKGINSNNHDMFQKRWSDFNYCEEEGESLCCVQKRNIEALHEILANHADESIVIGTHGTALSTILNYYNSDYGCNDYLRIIDYMPYLIRLDFNGLDCIGKEELLIIEKEFTGNNRAIPRL